MGQSLRYAVNRGRTAVPLALWAGMVVAGCTATLSGSDGHPISITQVSAYVQREKLTLAIDLFLEDLFLFHDLQPNAENRLEPATIADGMKRHRRFLLERVQVLDADTQPLEGTVVRVESFEIPQDGIPLGDLMSYSLTYTIEYPLEAPPRFLTFVQQLVDPALGIPAEMTLRVKQAGVEGDRVWALQSGKPEIVDFDWDTPPPSPEASEAEWDAWMKKKREATLGITSYSSVYSFFYIEDGEVRHEILIPLLTLEESVLIPRDDDLVLDLDEQQAAREQIAACFTARNAVRIDGRAAEAEVARIDFYGLNFVDFAKRAEAKPVGLASARVGIILRYPARRPPSEVEMRWDFFNDFIYEVQAMVYTDETVRQVTLTDETPESGLLRWKREHPWRPPEIAPVPVDEADSGIALAPPSTAARIVAGSFLAVMILLFAVFMLGIVRRESSIVLLSVTGALALVLVIGLAGTFAGRSKRLSISPEQQRLVFRSLHRNLYESFRYRREEPLYDALAVSVDGSLLRDLYLQIRRSLVMEEQGGAVSRIREVKILDERLVDGGEQDGSFQVRCRWSVEGTVEHWGHVHGRTNTYEALFSIAPRDGSWKLVDVDLLQEEQTAIETRLRGLPERE